MSFSRISPAFFMLIAVLTIEGAQAQQPVEDVLYRKPQPDGSELAVVCGPIRTSPELTRLLGNRGSAVREVSLELHAKQGEPVRLWSQTELCDQSSGHIWFEVMDMAVLRDRVLLATRQGVGPIALHEVNFGAPNLCDVLISPDSGWSMVQAELQLPGDEWPKASFKYDEKARQIDVEIVDVFRDKMQRTTLRTSDEEWKFVKVAQVIENAPATKPATAPSGN